MMKVFILFTVLLHSNLVSAETRPIQIPSVASFPVEGTVFTVICKTAGEIKDVKFIDNNNNDVKNSTDGKRTITKSTEGSVKVIYITWRPLRLSDAFLLSGLACQSTAPGATGYSYNIRLIPKANIPTVSIKQANVTVLKDSSLSLSCSSHLVWDPQFEAFELQWIFNNKVIVDEPGNFTINKIVDKKDNKTYELVIPKVAISHEGLYKCQANLKLTLGKSTTEDTFSSTVRVNVDWPPKKDYERKELVLMNKEKSVMECVMPGYPLPTIKWKKADSFINGDTDPRYQFEYSDEQKSDNATFIIKDVTYKDRAVYRCEATFKFRDGNEITVPREFVLRVRDPLGPLWPAIGILVEAVLLFIIIALYSCLKKPKHRNDKADIVDGPSVGDGEKSPLVKDRAHVSYNTGEDGVRARVNSGETA